MGGGLDITISNVNSSFGSLPVYSNRLPLSRFVALSHWCLLTLKGVLQGQSKLNKKYIPENDFSSASLDCLEQSVPQGKAYFIPASSWWCTERQTGGALGSVSLHTSTHAKWVLRTLLARRQVILPHCAIPLWSECHSILPLGMQPRGYYKSTLQASKCHILAHEGQRHVHARLRASAHTDVTCRMAVRTDVWLLATAEMRVLKTQLHPVQHGACGMSQQ